LQSVISWDAPQGPWCYIPSCSRTSPGRGCSSCPIIGARHRPPQDPIAGQIDFLFDQAWNSLAQVGSGTIRAYAVTAAARPQSAPDIPSVDEAGLPGLRVSVWNGGRRKERRRKWWQSSRPAVLDALADPAVRTRLADLGLEIPPREQQTPQALGALQRAEAEKWWPIIKAANIRAE
jgi:tripartite-type tricarboxylate transporter receptor subunit TctC